MVHLRPIYVDQEICLLDSQVPWYQASSFPVWLDVHTRILPDWLLLGHDSSPDLYNRHGHLLQIVGTERWNERFSILVASFVVAVELIVSWLVYWGMRAYHDRCVLFFNLKLVALSYFGITMWKNHTSSTVINVRYHWLQFRWHELLQLYQVNLMLAFNTMKRVKPAFQVRLSVFVEPLPTMWVTSCGHSVATAQWFRR